MKRVCLVSPGHVGSNPRLVKEANSLHAAGYQVHVIAGDYMAEVRSLDAAVFATARWSWTQVGLGSHTAYPRRRILQEVARKLALPHLACATWAHSPMSYRLAQAAIAHPADLYIAHCLAALPAAAIAAHHHRARFGFDAEDFHVGELLDTRENQAEIRVRDLIERTLLPKCHHLTAASPGIAAAYAERYSVEMEPILNVFSRSEAPDTLPKRNRKIPSLYWFSQTIGAGRGIEAIVQAMGQMQTPVELYLRGLPANGYVDQLKQLATSVNVCDRIHFLPSASPLDMVQLAAEHDIGLSLELETPYNRAICLTNKIFTYLLAGLPVLMSRTEAQSELSRRLGSASVLIDVSNATAIAQTLDQWLSDSTQLLQARQQAWTLGHTQYNWEIEQHRFLSVVKRALL
jgi:glycosyltransferase involved in cell wall biosynthesis